MLLRFLGTKQMKFIDLNRRLNQQTLQRCYVEEGDGKGMSERSTLVDFLPFFAFFLAAFFSAFASIFASFFGFTIKISHRIFLVQSVFLTTGKSNDRLSDILPLFPLIGNVFRPPCANARARPDLELKPF